MYRFGAAGGAIGASGKSSSQKSWIGRAAARLAAILDAINIAWRLAVTRWEFLGSAIFTGIRQTTIWKVGGLS
jgi:hypothetical protein